MENNQYPQFKYSNLNQNQNQIQENLFFFPEENKNYIFKSSLISQLIKDQKNKNPNDYLIKEKDELENNKNNNFLLRRKRENENNENNKNANDCDDSINNKSFTDNNNDKENPKTNEKSTKKSNRISRLVVTRVKSSSKKLMSKKRFENFNFEKNQKEKNFNGQGFYRKKNSTTSIYSVNCPLDHFTINGKCDHDNNRLMGKNLQKDFEDNENNNENNLNLNLKENFCAEKGINNDIKDNNDIYNYCNYNEDEGEIEGERNNNNEDDYEDNYNQSLIHGNYLFFL